MDFNSLSADTAHRFRAVANLLHRHGQTISATRPRLLDVGGYPGTFAREFTVAYPRWQAMTLDQPKENLPNYVAASGAKIPFPDGSFDAVISVDTFEHIPPSDRQMFLTEICRVSSGIVILAAPFHHEAVASCERLLDMAHQRAFNLPHPWLHEHVQHGLPPLMKTIGGWPVNFGIVEVKQSYDLSAWVTWQALSLFRKLKGDVDKAWNVFDSSFAGAPTPSVSTVPYRWIITGRRGEATIDLPASLLPSTDAGQDAVELARLYARMLEVSAQETSSRAEVSAAIAVDERLRQALVANEAQLTQQKTQSRTSQVGPISEVSRRASSITRLFRR